MTHHVAFLLVPDFQLLDMSGPAAVFQTAGRFAQTAAGPAYAVHVVSEHGGPVRSSCGIGVQTVSWHGTPADTLVVPGGEGARAAAVTPALKGFRGLRYKHPKLRQLLVPCTDGVFKVFYYPVIIYGFHPLSKNFFHREKSFGLHNSINLFPR